MGKRNDRGDPVAVACMPVVTSTGTESPFGGSVPVPEV